MAYLVVGVVFWPNFLANNLFKWMSLSLLPYGIYFGLGIVLFVRRDRWSPLDVLFIIGALGASYIEISARMAVDQATLGSPPAPMIPTLVFLLAVGFIVRSVLAPACSQGG